MGWPRKNDGGRIYKDKKERGYFIIFMDLEHLQFGGYEAIANVLVGDSPSLGTCTISPNYLANKWPKRVEWSELPEEWQRAFRPWLGDDVTPESIRGFWRAGNQPKQGVSP